jgi:hypothetical protein
VLYSLIPYLTAKRLRILVLTFPAFQRFSVWLIHEYSALTTTINLSLPSSRAACDAECDAGLVYPMDEYVTIATYDKTIDAHIALGRLAAEGIRAQLFDDNMVQMDWLYAIALGGIKLRVPLADEHVARIILTTDYSHDLDDMDLGEQEK